MTYFHCFYPSLFNQGLTLVGSTRIGSSLVQKYQTWAEVNGNKNLLQKKNLGVFLIKVVHYFFKLDFYNQAKQLLKFRIFYFWTFPGPFFSLIFHQVPQTNLILSCYRLSSCHSAIPTLLLISATMKLSISRARTTHTTREHRRRESVVCMHFCFRLLNLA